MHGVESAVEARAGFLDRPTMVVLVVSTGLIVGLLCLALHWFFRVLNTGLF